MNNKHKRYLIYGAGHIGHYLGYMYKTYDDAEIVGFIDDDMSKWGKEDVLGGSEDLKKFYRETKADGVIYGLSYSNMRLRGERYRFVKSLGLSIPSLVHPGAIVEKTAKIGDGCFVGAGTVLDESAELKDNVLINMNCVIGHNVLIDENAFLSSGINIAGYAQLQTGIFIGMGVTIIEKLNIAPFTFIGAGAIVVKNIDEGGYIHVGMPAKPLRKLEY